MCLKCPNWWLEHLHSWTPVPGGFCRRLHSGGLGLLQENIVEYKYGSMDPIIVVLNFPCSSIIADRLGFSNLNNTLWEKHHVFVSICILQEGQRRNRHFYSHPWTTGRFVGCWHFSGVIRLLKKDLEHVQMLVGLQWFVVIKLYHSSLCSSVFSLQLYNGYLQVWFKHRRSHVWCHHHTMLAEKWHGTCKAHIWIEICKGNGAGLPISRRKMHASPQRGVNWLHSLKPT